MARVKGGAKIPFLRGMSPHKLAESTLFASSMLNKGMYTNIDPADIPDGALVIARNARVRYDKTIRRSGKSVYSAAAPNANQVKRLITYEPSKGTIYVIRLTQTGGHYTDGIGWTALAGTIAGGDNFIDTAVAEGTLVIANGEDRLQKIDLSLGTISDLGTIAPRARYCTGFAERVVAASVGTTPNGTSTLYWSGNQNITEFDAAEDISAGNKPIVTSGKDSVDPISGLFGLTNVMIIPRESSIWLATKQPIASNPFNTYSALSGIGADLPSAIARTESGIIFPSVENGAIFDYTPGQQLTGDSDIAWTVNDELFAAIEDSAILFSDYNKNKKEFMFGIPESDFGGCKLWIWNRITKAWSYDEVDDASAILSHIRLSDYTSFDDLTGTFDALTGTFDGLSVTPKRETVVLLGYNDGVILEEDSSVVKDNTVAFTFEARSKEFKFPREDTLMSELKFEYNGITAGTFAVQYSKDHGTNWITASNPSIVVGSAELLTFKKPVKARRIMWRITSLDGDFELINYEVSVYVSGESTS